MIGSTAYYIVTKKDGTRIKVPKAPVRKEDLKAVCPLVRPNKNSK